MRVSIVASPARRSARKAKGDGHLRRAEILEAAERIFVAEGYEGATIRKIADVVGVSSTALYMHFQDKDAILLEICNGALRQLLARNRELVARPEDAAVRLRAMLEGYMRWALEHPNAYQLVYSAPRPVSAGDWPADTIDLSTQCYEIFRGVVREIAAEGRLRRGGRETAAQALWMGCHGLITLLIARPQFPWRPTDELIGMMLEGLTAGFVAD